MNDETIRQLRDDAESGDVDAQFRLACCLAGGTGVPKDETEAEHWMNIAAEQGHADARKMLGWDSGIPSPQLSWNGPLESIFRLVLSKTRWQVARFFCEIGAVVGIISGCVLWAFPPEKSFGSEIVTLFGPTIIFLYGVLSAVSGIVVGLVLYEIAKYCSDSEATLKRP